MKNLLNFDDDPFQNDRVAASLDLCYNLLHITHFRRHSVGVASVFRMLHMNRVRYDSATWRMSVNCTLLALAEVCALLSAC